jgi:uncharacterized RDD family membrane protein YckC
VKTVASETGAALANAPIILAPSLKRRLAALVYEGILIFGVGMAATFAYSSLTQMRHALQGRAGLMAFLYAVCAVYFVWFWTHGGQTVATKTWHIQVVDIHGSPVTAVRAVARFVLSSVSWFLAAPSIAQYAGLSTGGVAGVSAIWLLAYAAAARLNPGGQFWHDVVCGTRLVDARPQRAT